MSKFRDEFKMSSEAIHLNNAGFTPLTRAAREAVVRLADQQVQEAALGAMSMFAELEKSRQTFAEFLGVQATQVAFTANIATSISLAAWALPIGSGDVVLTTDQEYPSNAYPWLMVAKAKNARVETLPSRADLSIDWDRFLSAIRPGVKVVAISWVQYKAGTTAPLKAISEACRRVGAWFVVDGIQGLGAIPFNLRDTGVDIVCGGAHKWMCGLTGVGFMGFREGLADELTPIIQGSRTYGGPDDPVSPDRAPVKGAVRFEAGGPSMLPIIASAASVRTMLNHGMGNLSGTSRALRERLAMGLRAKGFEILGDSSSVETSPIVTVRGPGVPDLVESLQKNRVSHVLRAHGLRLSPHAFNTEVEIDAVLGMCR